MEAVQFLGIENIVEAFGNLGVPNWAVFHGKRMLEKYEGVRGEDTDIECAKENLRNYLELLSRSNTKTVYRLCTYEDWQQGNKIRPSTECDRSFNFQLFDGGVFVSESASGFREINERLKRIEARQAILDDEEKEEKVSGISGYLDKLISIPEVQSRIAGLIGNILDKIIPTGVQNQMQQSLTQPAAVGSVPGDQESQYAKINEALQVLANIDPHLGDNLLKVAEIARTNPQKYFSLIKML